MELFFDLLKVLLPSGLMLYAVYLTVRLFVKKELDKLNIDLKARARENTIPLRIQAMERLILFLERIHPYNLVLQLNEPHFSISELQMAMVTQIREEYNHNVAQQLYVSEQTFKAIKNAKDEVIGIIQLTGREISADATTKEYIASLFGYLAELPEQPNQIALSLIKREAQQLF